MNAATSSARINSLSSISSRFLSFCWRTERFGTFSRNMRELKRTTSDFSRRTRWINTGTASAMAPKRKNGFRNDIFKSISDAAGPRRQVREQTRIERLGRIHQCVINLGSTEPLLQFRNMLIEYRKILGPQILRNHMHLLQGFEVFELRHVFKWKRQLVVVHDVKGHDVVPFGLERFQTCNDVGRLVVEI